MPVNKKPGIFISGKMRSVPYYGFPAFDKARDRLAGLGLTPLSPADMDRAAGFDPYNWWVTMGEETRAKLFSDVDWSVTPPSFDLAAAIARDNAAIDDPDTVAVYVIHEGISESAGGMAEIERGMKRGLVILYDTMSDGDILRALGIEVGGPTPPDNPNPSSARLSARGMAMLQVALKANDPCATVFGKAGAAALRAHIEKGLADAGNPAQTFFTDPVTGGRKGAFASLTAEQKADVLAGKEIRVTDPVTGAHTSMRLARFDLIPQDILWEFAEVYGVGAVKHGDSNMEGGYPWSWSYQKAQRHLSRFWQGEDMDTETRILHVLQSAWHCFTMAWFLRHNAGTDDRPVTGKKGDTRE